MRSHRLFLLGTVLTLASLPASMDGQVDRQAPLGSERNPVHVSSGIAASNLLPHRSPFYPDSEGPYESSRLVARVIITPEGKVDQVVMISGHESLRRRFIEAVRQWTYKPYLLNGEAVWVESIVSVNVDFGA